MTPELSIRSYLGQLYFNKISVYWCMFILLSPLCFVCHCIVYMLYLPLVTVYAVRVFNKILKSWKSWNLVNTRKFIWQVYFFPFSNGQNVGQNIFFTPDASQIIFLGAKIRARKFFFKKSQALPRKSNGPCLRPMEHF